MARPRQISDEEILETARACFMEDPAVPTSRIAKLLGVSQAAIFKRFGTKMRLMLAALGVEEGPPWAKICDAGPDDRPIDEQLREIGGELNRFFSFLVPRIMALKAVGVRFPQMFQQPAGSNPLAKPPPPVIGLIALAGFFQRAIDQGRLRPGDPDGLAIAFLGMFQSRAFWRHMADGAFPIPLPDDDAYIAHTVELFWRGVVPEETP